MQPYCVLFTNQLSQTKYHKFISLWALPMKCLPMKIIILKAKDSRLKREKNPRSPTAKSNLPRQRGSGRCRDPACKL